MKNIEKSGHRYIHQNFLSRLLDTIDNIFVHDLNKKTPRHEENDYLLTLALGKRQDSPFTCMTKMEILLII